MLTEGETSYSHEITERVAKLRSFLESNEISEPEDFARRYRFLTVMKLIQGNLSNDISFVATLLAKTYLEERLGVTGFDAASKAQGAPGLDIDVRALDGSRIIGEIKTTVPYETGDFGAQQKTSFQKDFRKLVAGDAEHKFMFVTEQESFEILQRTRYLKQLEGIIVVQLLTREAFGG